MPAWSCWPWHDDRPGAAADSMPGAQPFGGPELAHLGLGACAWLKRREARTAAEHRLVALLQLVSTGLLAAQMQGLLPSLLQLLTVIAALTGLLQLGGVASLPALLLRSARLLLAALPLALVLFLVPRVAPLWTSDLGPRRGWVTGSPPRWIPWRSADWPAAMPLPRASRWRQNRSYPARPTGGFSSTGSSMAVAGAIWIHRAPLAVGSSLQGVLREASSGGVSSHPRSGRCPGTAWLSPRQWISPSPVMGSCA